MLQVVRNENGSVTVKQDTANVAGIALENDLWLVAPAEGIAIDPLPFAELDQALAYVARELGESVKGSSAPAGKGKRSSSKRSRTPAPAPAPAPAGKKKGAPASAPVARERNVSPVMQRNLAELASGNYPVFVESAELMKQLRESRSTRALVVAGVIYRNGTGNIYPTPAQAKRIAKQYPGTTLALQCELGGYTAWRNSLRKRASAPAANDEVAA